MPYRIQERYFDNGKVECIAAEVDEKKETFYSSRKNYDLWISYVDTKEEAERIIEECENA